MFVDRQKAVLWGLSNCGMTHWPYNLSLISIFILKIYNNWSMVNNKQFFWEPANCKWPINHITYLWWSSSSSKSTTKSTLIKGSHKNGLFSVRLTVRIDPPPPYRQFFFIFCLWFTLDYDYICSETDFINLQDILAQLQESPILPYGL